jgi:aminopeptidase YwaD
MKKYFFLCFLLHICLTITAQNLIRAKANIDTLASEDFHGRGYVNGGDRKAADFIARKFLQLQLKSFNQSYFQAFSFPVNTFPGKVSLKIDGKKLEPGKDFILNPLAGSGKTKGKIVFLDTLIFESEAARLDFMRKDVRKNILVYKSKYYGSLMHLPVEYLNHLHEASALLELTDKKLTASVASQQFNHPVFEVLNSRFPPKATKAGFEVEAVLIKKHTSQNVIAYVPGKTKPEEFVVISAHYDHLGQLGKKTYFPGANDNASGVAMLLELADFYAKPENQPNFSVCFMAFGAEEVGLLGSKHYVQNPLFPLNQIKRMINLDIVGTGDEGITIVNTADNPEDLAKFQQINEQYKFLPKINKRANAANSDHYFFTGHGVKAFFIYTMGGIKAYHDINDKPETLPLTKFEGLFKLIKNYISII